MAKASILSALEAAEVRRVVEANVEIDPESGCWYWPGDLDPDGYGLFLGRRVHRLSYMAFVGPIPAGFHVDHGCRHRNCCNALKYLEAVSAAENLRRAMAYVQQYPGERTHQGARRWCVRRHPFDEANTGRDGANKRYCKKCRRSSLAEYRASIQQPRGWEWHVDASKFEALADQFPPVPGEPMLNTGDVAIRFGMRLNTLNSWCRRNPHLAPAHVPRQRWEWPESHVKRLEACWTAEQWKRDPKPK